MPHLIPDNEIERLSILSGVLFDEFKRQIAEIDTNIIERLHDSVEASWQDCLPIWIAFGRVSDLSHRIRAPYYFPSSAKRLGNQFAEVHCKDYAYLINLLREMPTNSYEYLCAYDLLEMIAYEFYEMDRSILDEIFAIDLSVPPVVLREKGWDEQFHGLESIGKFIHQSCLIEYGEDV
jgi:hypothetical protein